MRVSRVPLIAVALALAIVVIAAALASGSGPTGAAPPLVPVPAARAAAPLRGGDPFGYVPADRAAFVARAIAGESHVLFALSPGGVLATAARVARFRSQIDRAIAGTGISPDVLEGIVFLESAGRPQVIAGGDPANAAGLTQIVASTGEGLLGMHIELAASRRLTAQIDTAQATGRGALAARLQKRRAALDDRFNPAKALAATVRYLLYAERQLGRSDLAIESYHMGIGNLEHVLALYDGGTPVPYAQLYFDTAPDRHAAAYGVLSGLGDDSSTYLWRVGAAMGIMHLYRNDPAQLRQLVALHDAAPSAAEVLHPPAQTPPFADPAALDRAYTARTLVPLPSDPHRLGLAYNPQMGWAARGLGAPRALYRGLRPAALALLLELAARVRTLSGATPLIVQSTVIDSRYASRVEETFPGATTGYAFQIARRYVDPAQAGALQSMLDRLQALNLIAWDRTPDAIDVSVASDAAQVIAHGV